jgi:hypothetical protein
MPTGRNDPCPCGSGNKYKKCCQTRDEAASIVGTGWLRIRRTEGEVMDKLASHMTRCYGPGALDEAWDEYTLWSEPPAVRDEWPEYKTSFLPWLMFDWEPEQNQSGERVERPELTAARHYARHKGMNLDSYERRYIEAVCSEPCTFYLVVTPVPGRAITLRDIFRQREVTVHERQASTTLRPGEIVFTKVVSLDGEAVMLGCAPYPIPARYFDAIVELRESIARNRDVNAESLREYDTELRGLYLDLREEMVNPAPPRLQNTDGDPLQMTRINYELDCSPQEAFSALLPLTIEDDPDAFAGDCERDEAGELVAVQIPWLREGNAKNPGWSNTLMGQIDIRQDRMTVNVNSQARADAIRAETTARLGPRARVMGVVVESVEQMMAAAAGKGTSRARSEREREIEEFNQSPEGQAVMAKVSAEHWRTWPDIPLPALGGQTPRQAAKTSSGRERLEVLLLDFTSRERTPGAMRPDVVALRRELGI